MSDEPIYYVDRSGAELDDACAMAFWWNRKEGGMGIVPKKENFHHKLGREVHEDLAAIAEMEDISAEAIDKLIREITDPLTDQDKLMQEQMEVLYRRLGWIAANALFLEPRERETFETTQVEREIILDRTPLWTAITPDNVRRHRVERYLKYREYKTVRWANPAWVQHWQYDIQMHLGLASLEEELGEPVAYGQIIGLMKGEYRDGKLSHPYVWAYYSPSKDAWEHDYTKARGGDWEKRPIWEYEPGVVAWVQRLGAELALAQFPHSAPVFLNRRMLDNWVQIRTAREEEILVVQDECAVDPLRRLMFFPQRTRMCRPSNGDPCPYLAACWNASVNANPLASGLYEPRQPHHQIELELVGGPAELPTTVKETEL